jgi:hypothetical protein
MNEVKYFQSYRHLNIPLELALALEKRAHEHGDIEHGAWAREAKRVLRAAVEG